MLKKCKVIFHKQKLLVIFFTRFKLLIFKQIEQLYDSTLVLTLLTLLLSEVILFIPISSCILKCLIQF